MAEYLDAPLAVVSLAAKDDRIHALELEARDGGRVCIVANHSSGHELIRLPVTGTGDKPVARWLDATTVERATPDPFAFRAQLTPIALNDDRIQLHLGPLVRGDRPVVIHRFC